MKTSREYQTALENEIPKRLVQSGPVIVQAPTGAGKSHIINSIVKRILRAHKTPLVISDSTRIHAQLVAECNGVCINPSVKHLCIFPGHCYVAMSQTLRNRHEIIEQFAYRDVVLIVDECHRNTMTPLIEEMKPMWLIGFSATPHWRWAKHLQKLYKSLIQGPHIKELITDGFLAHYRHFIRTGAELDKLEKSGAEYSEKSQERVFSTARIYDGLFEDLPKLAGRKIAIFTASIKLCEALYEQLLQREYKVVRYHSELSRASYELSRYTELNECNVLVSVSSLTMGWDCPSIDTIVLWRATTSLPLYLQMIGRGSRMHPGKSEFTVLDYGGNFERFGAWDMNRDWNTLWREPEDRKRKISTYAGVSGSKDCPVCIALLPVTARSCWNCGYVFPEDEMKLIEGKLLEVRNTLQGMNSKRLSELTASELALYAEVRDRKAHAIRVAKARGESFLREFAKCIGYKDRWVDKQLEMITPGERIDYADIKFKL